MRSSASSKEAPRATNGRAAGSAEHTAALQRFGVAAWEAPGLAIEDPAGDPLQGKRISDLEIQSRLDNLLSGAPIDANAVYVVFLAPGEPQPWDIPG